MDPSIHCLNCCRSMEGNCQDYNRLWTWLVTEGIEIDQRISAYRELCIANSCHLDKDIFAGD